MNIKEFLAQKPSLSQILNFVEKEARRIASEKRKQKLNDQRGTS